ncbi:Ca2+-binding protein, RTX toxin-related [Phyllobacterium sp. YR620]|uniref:calcium-binding protein n=1 Tax=Phyllobacterium sp. YR620 TaxID=1881066 RepID=UPI000885D117|nr:cadherin-like domain-containing protein [Phyllobacterium sp. YR620]SDP88699.1 Ca2+-binding protein, RTX toxin-related [Phyllobacterium sp. YR620]
MIIDVKSTKVDGVEADPQARYLLSEKKRSSLPRYFIIVLTGIMLYLKSFWPDDQKTAASEESEPEADVQDATPPVLKLVGNYDTWADDVSDVAGLAVRDRDAPILTPTRNSSFDVGVVSNSVAATMVASPQKMDFSIEDFVRGFGSVSLSLRAANDNPPDFAARSPAAGAVGGADEWGQNNGPVAFEQDQDPDEDGEPTPEKPHQNRAPRTAGPVQLHDVVGCGLAYITLADLLRNTTDPDGDSLSIRNVSTSSGTITHSSGGWMFEAMELGPVTISYQITDGALNIWQTAYFAVVAEPLAGTGGVFVGTDLADDISGTSGDDIIDARAGKDSIFASDGDDNVVGGSGDDTIYGGAGNDILFGGSGNDWISGGAGKDRVFAGSGNDIAFGDDGDDWISGGEGSDLIFGGSGNDCLLGDFGDDVLDGGGGDDSVFGDDGNDRLLGASGADKLDGGGGNDFLSGGEGSDTVAGGQGNDVVAGDMDAVADNYSGDAGFDTIDYSSARRDIALDATTRCATGVEIGEDTISGFEIYRTGAGDDTVIGSLLDDAIFTNEGDDTIVDGGGCDTIDAGSGNDTILAAADGANDRFIGSAGVDTISYAQSGAGVVIDMDNGTATGVMVGSDIIDGFERVIGGEGNDHLVAASDTVSLTGGNGDDIFEFKAKGDGAAIIHEILDFMVGDRIRISQYDIFNEVMDAIEDRFENIYGETERPDLPIRISHAQTENMNRTLIEADLDGDGYQDLTISLDGHHMLMFVENV